VTTSNYSRLTNSQTFQFTRARTYFSFFLKFLDSCESVIYCTIASGPCQSSHPRGEVPQNSRPYFTVSFETPPTWRARSPYLYPPGTGWPSYTPGYRVTHTVLLVTSRHGPHGKHLPSISIYISVFVLHEDPIYCEGCLVEEYSVALLC
jgi:hypothetical protein